MTFNVLKSLALGSDFGGLGPDGANTLAYSVNNAEGDEVVASTNSGLTERASGGGSYRLLLSVNTAWGDFCEIIWTIGGVPLNGVDEDLPIAPMMVPLVELAALSLLATETNATTNKNAVLEAVAGINVEVPANQDVEISVTESETIIR